MFLPLEAHECESKSTKPVRSGAQRSACNWLALPATRGQVGPLDKYGQRIDTFFSSAAGAGLRVVSAARSGSAAARRRRSRQVRSFKARSGNERGPHGADFVH